MDRNAQTLSSSRAAKRRRASSRTKKDVRARIPSKKQRAPRAAVQELIGAFRLLEQIADPSGRELHLAERVRKGAPSDRLVIELVRRERETFESDKSSLLARAALLGASSHPNWVSVIDAGEEEEGAYLAVEHVDGVSLEKILARLRKKHQGLPIEIACFIAIELLRGLHAAIVAKQSESIAIIARDLLPANVLISRTGQVKLAHTVFVPETAPSGSATVRVGEKPRFGYYAPELIERSEFTARSAIYSAGAIFFELLGGTVPLAGALDAKQLAREAVPEELIYVVTRATNARPIERFAKASDVADAIEAWLVAAGRPLTPSMIEKFFSGSGAQPRTLRGSSAIIEAVGQKSPAPPPPPIDRKVVLEKGRRVREKHATRDTEDMAIIVGTPDEAPPSRVPSLVQVRYRPRRNKERPPIAVQRKKPRPSSSKKVRIALELIVLLVAIAAAVFLQSF